MSKPQDPTLGQRIDALLEPLYAEADQHRATIALVKEQQLKLQEQIDAAEHGLNQIETRMAEVVRAMAGQEPVIAAVVGGTSTPNPSHPSAAPIAPESEPPSEPTAAAVPTQSAEPLADIAPQTPGEAVQPQATAAEVEVEVEAGEVQADPAPAPAQAIASPTDAPVADELKIADAPEIELDPVADAAAVDEAAALLDLPPAEQAPDRSASEAPKIDLAAAAERAAAAAKQLREKAAAK